MENQNELIRQSQDLIVRLNEALSSDTSCKICGQKSTITKIAVAIPSGIATHDCIYCYNCGHAVFDLAEFTKAIDNFKKIK